MSRLLLASVIKDKICAYLSFEDVVSLRDALGLSSLKAPILVTDSKNNQIILPGVNPTTIEVYELIKQHGCDLVFLKAAKTGENQIVQTLLTIKNINVNAVNQNGETVLMRAVRCDRNEVVQTLLTVKDININ